MTKFNGDRVCGKRASYNFASPAVRPITDETAKYDCPSGTAQCGTIEGLTASETMEKYKDNIICVLNDSVPTECPITTIKFLPVLSGQVGEN